MASKGTFVTSGYKPGDIACMTFDDTDFDHVGIVIAINPGGVIVTVEGNTGVGNDANGGAVMVRLRTTKYVKGACRPAYSSQAEIERVITAALAEVGTTEYPAGSNKVKYNDEYDGRNEAWCVKFIWCIFQYAGVSELFYGGGKIASSTRLAEYYGYSGGTSAVTVNVQLTQIQNGNKGDHVKAAQRLLNAHGFNAGEVDGDFGPATQAAVKAFQTARSLAVDGVIGAKTWGALLT